MISARRTGTINFYWAHIERRQEAPLDICLASIFILLLEIRAPNINHPKLPNFFPTLGNVTLLNCSIIIIVTSWWDGQNSCLDEIENHIKLKLRGISSCTIFIPIKGERFNRTIIEELRNYLIIRPTLQWIIIYKNDPIYYSNRCLLSFHLFFICITLSSAISGF